MDDGGRNLVGTKGRPGGLAGQSASALRKLQEKCFLAHVAGTGLADRNVLSLGFVDMAAEEVCGLLLFDELAHSLRPGMQAALDAVQVGPERRGVAYQYQRIEVGEQREFRLDLLLGIFAWRIEGRDRRV